LSRSERYLPPDAVSDADVDARSTEGSCCWRCYLDGTFRALRCVAARKGRLFFLALCLASCSTAARSWIAGRPLKDCEGFFNSCVRRMCRVTRLRCGDIGLPGHRRAPQPLLL
jgi:hypothetical protein